MNGYLPERITYVCAKAETSEIWDDEGKKVIAKFKVVPTFPVEMEESLILQSHGQLMESIKQNVLMYQTILSLM